MATAESEKCCRVQEARAASFGGFLTVLCSIAPIINIKNKPLLYKLNYLPAQEVPRNA